MASDAPAAIGPDEDAGRFPSDPGVAPSPHGTAAAGGAIALDPLTLPLNGRRLVEASAGTGKTFTLALLYTRLVLGHGGSEAAFERPLTPPEILVVTFTEAATQELRERIRARLVEAAACFDEAPGPGSEDPAGAGATPDPLRRLRDQYPIEDWPACAGRLRRAADWMDEAMIATIHGWCRRMLQEHAFETRGLFRRELVTDQTDLIAEILRDYWRLHFYGLSPEQAAPIQAVVASPAALQELLKPWMARRDAALSYKGRPVRREDLDAALAAIARLARERARVAELEDAARALWKTHREVLEGHLRDLRIHLNGSRHDSSTPEKLEALLAGVAAWSEGGPAPARLEQLAQGRFAFKKHAKVRSEPEHPALAAIAHWRQAVAEVAEPEPPLAAALSAHAADWVGRELGLRLRRRAEMGYDDLLRDLDAALGSADGGAPLAATIRRRCPVALIDEFQDTDRTQYRIFERIYGAGRDAGNPSDPGGPAAATPVERRDLPGSEAGAGEVASQGAGAARIPDASVVRPQTAGDTALILIGDPKQSIYGFRGADIQAYLDARRATGGRLYTLDTNYRSTRPMVAACNRFFEQAESHARGAFRFRDASDHPIPYRRVRAGDREARLILDGRAATAFTLWTLDTSDQAIGSTDYRRRMAAATASEIVRWLEQARGGRAGFRDRDGLRPLLPRDIAILVRTGSEAAVMREALTARGIPSVYLSDRDSVFGTPEARDVLAWLRACAAPAEEGLVRAALATNRLDLPLATLAAWRNDEIGWEAQLERFRAWRDVWRRQGVLAMLRALLHEVDLPARLLARPDGERILTNLLHLAEWLQQSSVGLDGEQALIRHLQAHLDRAGEEFVVRLESDAELVQVVSIHKSKGLEYPLVLLPFICGWREVDGHARSVSYRLGARQVLEVAGKKVFPDAWAAADDERLSEDMRLLYVAVTRARDAVRLGIAPVKSSPAAKGPELHKSAIGYLLGGGERFETARDLGAALERLRGDCPEISVEPAPASSDRRSQPPAGAGLEEARAQPVIRHRRWWIASYSSLRRGTTARAADGTPSGLGPDLAPDTAARDTALEESGDELDVVAEPAAEGRRVAPDPHLHGLPRGRGCGTFLHGVLEWAAAQRIQADDGSEVRGFAAAARSPALRREMLGRRCPLQGLSAWIEPLETWLGDFLVRPWTLAGLPDSHGRVARFALRDLTPRQVQVEMEFWLESHGVETATLDRLVCAHCLAGHPRPPLAADRLEGMLKGFIDLVFEQAGRYYVLDWKSNWLGRGDADYSAESMRAAVLHSRYDLQYVLYLLALHRLLRARLPGYDYDRHVGGAVYVFLRGSHGPAGGLFTDRPPRELIEDLDRRFAGRLAATASEGV